MRIYRALWTPAAAVVTVAAWAAGVREPGWVALVVSSLFIGLVGAFLAHAWGEDRPLLSPAVGIAGVGSAVATSVVIGLPTLLGSWALLALPLIAASTPEVVEQAARWVRARRPLPGDRRLRRWSERALERRWRSSASELRAPRTSLARRVAIVEERARLLDELERRDPEQLRARLARAGWQVSET